MPTLEDVYQKFGFASEAAQLLETQVGNLLILSGALDAGLIDNPDSARASVLVDAVNRQTLGQLLKNLHRSSESLDELQGLLKNALKSRNRLSHSFYREHNFRKNSDDGRALMMEDLDAIHDTLLDAYKAVMLLSGVDLDHLDHGPSPTKHLPI